MHTQQLMQKQAEAESREREQAIRLANLAGVANPEQRVTPELTATVRFGDPNLAALLEKEARIQLNEESLAKLEAVRPSTEDAPVTSVEEVEGVGSDLARELEARNFFTPDDLREASDEDLLAVDGIGQAKLRRIREAL